MTCHLELNSLKVCFKGCPLSRIVDAVLLLVNNHLIQLVSTLFYTFLYFVGYAKLKTSFLVIRIFLYLFYALFHVFIAAMYISLDKFRKRVHCVNAIVDLVTCFVVN